VAIVERQIERMTQACPLCGATAIRHLHERPFQDVNWKLACCDSCGLHFTDPKPTLEQMARFYSGDFHEQLREPGGSERAFGDRFRRYIEWIQKFVPSGRTLDVGCSTGLLPWMLKQKGYAAEGIELHSETARWGAEHYGIPIRVGSVELVAQETGQYDLITMTEVVEHTPDPVEFLQAVNRLLKPGGYALVTFPDIQALKSHYYRWMSKLTGREWVWVSCHIPLHTWEFTYDTAKATFTKAGFSITGFQRTEVDGELVGKFAPLTWPVKPMTMGPLAKKFGSQMEFMIRKNPV
jgi:2-polyprenyl-3-methyl-5-hydroxy-6-metoxy-1,4-benzoquinol methylase